MDRSYRAEVPMVEGCHLRLAEPLGQGNDARIDHTKRQVPIAVLQFTAAREIGAGWWLKAIGAGQHIIEKDEPGIGREPTSAPVVKLGQDEGRHDQVLGRVGQHMGTAGVVRIRSVQRREERPGVKDEHDSAREIGDRLASDLRRAPTVG